MAQLNEDLCIANSETGEYESVRERCLPTEVEEKEEDKVKQEMGGYWRRRWGGKGKTNYVWVQLFI